MTRHERLYHSAGDAGSSHTVNPINDQSTDIDMAGQPYPGGTTVPDLGSGLGHVPEVMPMAIPNISDPLPQVNLSQEGMQIPDPFWVNDAFSFPQFVPSQFLDTDVSLYDLFQQAPPSGGFESQAPLQNTAAQHQNPKQS